MCAAHDPLKYIDVCQRQGIVKREAGHMAHKYVTDLDRAKIYIISNPHESKVQQGKALGVSDATIARARRELIQDGRLSKSRKTMQVEAPKEVKDEPRTLSKPAGLLDHEAMQAMADMIDTLTDLDDEEIHKRLLKQCIQFAFNPRLHPDTRMSASQMWAKLRDQAKSKDLGPGAPVNFEGGVERLRDLMVACGAPMTLAAVNSAFKVEEPSDQAPSDQAPDDQIAPPLGVTKAPIISGHEGEAEEADRLWDERMAGDDRPDDPQEDDLGCSDLSRPTA
jgi:hypothetical protein